MTREQFIKAWAENMIAHPEWRVGQAWYNTLHELAPVMAKWVDDHPHLDTFQTDANLGAVMEWMFGGKQIERTNYSGDAGRAS